MLQCHAVNVCGSDSRQVKHVESSYKLLVWLNCMCIYIYQWSVPWSSRLVVHVEL